MKVEVKVEQTTSRPIFHEPVKYSIHICGIVGENVVDYYSGMIIQNIEKPDQEPETRLTGWLADQASLMGMLNLLHDWGHSLISVEYLSS